MRSFPAVKNGLNSFRHEADPPSFLCESLRLGNWRECKAQVFSTTFFRQFKEQSGAWRNRTSFGLNDPEALVTVAHKAKEWISVHALMH